MDRGTDTGAKTGLGAGDGTADHAGVGRIPLAVVVVDRGGLVSHWSSGAGRLFGTAKEGALGRPALDLLPISGAFPDEDETPPSCAAYHAYDGLGPDLESSLDGGLSYPAAGRARLTVPERGEPGVPPPEGRGGGRIDVLWWAYPLVGPGRERLLVLAADTETLRGRDGGADVAVGRVAPGFAPHADFPGAEELARRLPEILPSMSVGESARIVAQVLELGYPILEFSQSDRVPVTPDWGGTRRTERQTRRRGGTVAGPGGPGGREDLEHAAVRERLEFLNEVSGRIGISLDLSQTIVEVSRTEGVP